MLHVTSASTALQTTSENLLQAFDLICTKSSFLFKVGVGRSLFINFALLMSIFNDVIYDLTTSIHISTYQLILDVEICVMLFRKTTGVEPPNLYTTRYYT